MTPEHLSYKNINQADPTQGRSDWKGYFTDHGVNKASGPMDEALKSVVLK